MGNLRIRRGPLLVLMVVLAVVMTGCSRSAGSNEVSVSGSTTIQPIAEVSAEMFQEANQGTRVLVSGVGSAAGIESVSQGSCDIGTSSRDLKPEEASLGLVDIPMAYDAVVVIVNPSNPVKNLSMQQVKQIFTGAVTNWKQVGGPDLAIGLVNRDEASGTREAFGKIALNNAAFDTHAAVLPGTGQVRSVVSGAPGAVGYISYGFVTDEVKAVAIDGVAPSPKTAISGAYPIRRVLHFLTKGPATGMAKRYIDFVLSPAVQDKVVSDAGFIPITDKVAK
jgi:phosphate transport system substrate-binding protein